MKIGKLVLSMAPVVCVFLSGCSAKKGDAQSLKQDTILVESSNFSPGFNMTAKGDSSNMLQFVLEDRGKIPFNQSVVKQTTEQSSYGPSANIPYFTVRFAIPIPPAYTETETAALTGIDKGVYTHSHSPGFEILPNGDALAIYFSAPVGKSENDTATTFVQSRLRYGSEDWDMPEQFFYTRGGNDQSGLLWNDNGKIWFFGGGRYISDYVPFRIATSTDNGASWTFSIPQLDSIATNYTAQPIVNAFRDPSGAIYMAMDGKDSRSFLWRSTDEGKTWHDMGGRTGGRHSTIVPLDDKGTLLSIGGKNADVDGWSPQNISHDWGATWSESVASPFPPLGSVQRPCLIKLASGNLLFVSDSYMHKKKIAPPTGWKYGNDAFVAISKDNGKTWRIKTLPVQLPQRHRPPYGSLGYSTVRQAPNGVIHLLTTAGYPPIHYEFNEAWVWSDAADVTPESSGGEVKNFSEKYSDGKLKSTWSARICPNGRYLLHGELIDYYPDGSKQHQALYENGRKTGGETYWSKDGQIEWMWQRDLKKKQGIWTQYWPNGNKKVESVWNIKPEARDLKREFNGYVADGPSKHWDESGNLVETYQFKKGILVEDKK